MAYAPQAIGWNCSRIAATQAPSALRRRSGVVSTPSRNRNPCAWACCSQRSRVAESESFTTPNTVVRTGSMPQKPSVARARLFSPGAL
jgi:hypothetical protein